MGDTHEAWSKLDSQGWPKLGSQARILASRLESLAAKFGSWNLGPSLAAKVGPSLAAKLVSWQPG